MCFTLQFGKLFHHRRHLCGVICICRSTRLHLLSVDHFSVKLVTRNFHVRFDLLYGAVQMFFYICQILRNHWRKKFFINNRKYMQILNGNFLNLDGISFLNIAMLTYLKFIVPDATTFDIRKICVPTISSSCFTPFSVIPHLQDIITFYHHNMLTMLFLRHQITKVANFEFEFLVKIIANYDFKIHLKRLQH